MFLSNLVKFVPDWFEFSEPYHAILTSFSLLTNGRSLLKTGCGPNEISCLHGLRVISTMWIILDHRFSIQFIHPIRNTFYQFNVSITSEKKSKFNFNLVLVAK